MISKYYFFEEDLKAFPMKMTKSAYFNHLKDHPMAFNMLLIYLYTLAKILEKGQKKDQFDNLIEEYIFFFFVGIIYYCLYTIA